MLPSSDGGAQCSAAARISPSFHMLMFFLEPGNSNGVQILVVNRSNIAASTARVWCESCVHLVQPIGVSVRLQGGLRDVRSFQVLFAQPLVRARRGFC